MFIFDSESVYIGYSMKELGIVRDILSKGKIAYKCKVINHSAAKRGHFSSFGLNIDYEKQYNILVKRKDYDRAKYIINEVLRPK